MGNPAWESPASQTEGAMRHSLRPCCHHLCNLEQVPRWRREKEQGALIRNQAKISGSL